MKGFSKSIAYRFQPIWKIKNQMGKGKQLMEKVEENVELPSSDQFYEPLLNTEKCKKRSKKHKKRRREYQDLKY